MSSTLANDPQTAIRDIATRLEPALIEIRRDIHAHPELAFEEVRTAGVVARELARIGIAHTTGVAKTGVVGIIKGGRPGPVLIIRADMDALPIHEQTGLPFASTIANKMHACGHDIHTAVDPIVGAAHLITQLQTVVSREVNPLQPVVVTVGMINGGLAPNIIPDSVTFRGTVRTLHDTARDTAEAAIRRLCAGTHEGLRVRCEVTYRRGVPPLVNDDRVLDATIAAVRKQLGDVAVERGPVMGAEDFALMSQLVPSFQLGIGSGTAGRNDRLHNSGYTPDEACIALGVQALSRAALDLLS